MNYFQILQCKQQIIDFLGHAIYSGMKERKMYLALNHTKLHDLLLDSVMFCNWHDISASKDISLWTNGMLSPYVYWRGKIIYKTFVTYF